MRTRWSSWSRSSSTTEAIRTSDGWTPPRRHRSAPHHRHARDLRDHAARRHHPQSLEAGSSPAAASPRGRLPLGLLPGAGADRPSLRGPAQVPQADRRSEREGAKRPRAFYEQVLDFDERPDLDRGNGVWDLGSAEAAEMAKLAETTYRDVNIGLANQFALFAETSGIDVFQVIEASNSQPYSHIHPPGISVGGHCIPVYPRLSSPTTPTPPCTAAREANAAMPRTRSTCSKRPTATSPDTCRRIGGGLPGRGQRDRVQRGLPHSGELVGRGATVTVQDPLYTADELVALGLTPHTRGDTVEAAIIHTDHSEYAALRMEDFPGLRTLVDGRQIVPAGRLDGVELVTLGQSR